MLCDLLLPDFWLDIVAEIQWRQSVNQMSELNKIPLLHSAEKIEQENVIFNAKSTN